MNFLLPIGLLSGNLNLLIINLSLLSLLLNTITCIHVLLLRLYKLVPSFVFSSNFFLLFGLLNYFSIFSVRNLLAKWLTVEISFIFHSLKNILFFVKKGHPFETFINVFEKVSKKHFLDLIESFHYNFF